MLIPRDKHTPSLSNLRIIETSSSLSWFANLLRARYVKALAPVHSSISASPRAVTSREASDQFDDQICSLPITPWITRLLISNTSRLCPGAGVARRSPPCGPLHLLEAVKNMPQYRPSRNAGPSFSKTSIGKCDFGRKMRRCGRLLCVFKKNPVDLGVTGWSWSLRYETTFRNFRGKLGGMFNMLCQPPVPHLPSFTQLVPQQAVDHLFRTPLLSLIPTVQLSSIAC